MKDYISRWLAFPDAAAMKCASKPYGDQDGFDTTFYDGKFNGSISFIKVKDVAQVCFNGWLRIDKLFSCDGKTCIAYVVYHGKNGLAWKPVESYEAKSLSSLFKKMDLDGALFDEPSIERT